MAQPEVLHRAALIHFGKAGVAVTASCPAQLELTGPGGSGTKYLLVRDSSTQTLLQLPVQRDLCCLPADSAAATIYDSQQQGWLAQFASAEDWHAFARQLGLARSLDLPSYDSPATPKLSELASASRSLDSRSGSASAAILSEILAAKHQQAASSPFAVVRAQPSRVQALEKRPSPFQVAAYAAGADGAPKDKAPQPATDLGALRTSGDMASANSSPARTMHPSELGPRRTSGEPASTNGGPTKPPYPAELGPRKISGEAAGASGSAPRSLQPANSAAATDASSQRTVHSCPEELMMDRRLSAGSVTSLGPDGDGVRPPHAMMLGRSYSEKHQLALKAGLSCSMGDVLARLDLLAQHLGIDVAATLPQPAAPQVPEVNKPNKVDSLISQVEASLQLPKGEEAAPGRSLSPTTAVRRQLEMVGKQLHSVQAQRAEEGRPTWRIPSELDLAKTQSLPGAMEVLPVGELTRLQQQLRFVEVSAADSEMEVARLQARLHESERAVAEAKSEAGGEASRQRVSDFAKQVADSMRSVMNQLYTSLAGEFEDDVSYKGREVEHVLRCTIRDSTSDAFEAIKAITSKAVAALESTGPTSVGPAEAKP
ncbi:hypothetical protein WJX72_010252 [[Myrmecia] bisecta]|uniref:Uncharacterized protein n=1 Tax=[Myrmecia] bisecta TaxID=41462 RepID=A0AAW1QG88_9CHLO